MPIAPDSILGEAISAVTDRLSDLDRIAATYNAQLSSALSQIASVQVADVPSPTRPEAPGANPPGVDLGDMPAFTPPQLLVPNAPPDINIDALLADLDVGDLDDFPDPPAMVPITIPEAPAMAVIEAPTRPDIDTTIDIPTAPTIEEPEMEDLTRLDLPDFVFPELPTFDAIPPDASGISVPNAFINWTEPVYASELLGELQAVLRAALAGGTGLPAPVEAALFARARERDSAETERAIQEAVAVWAARDFSMPPGMLVQQVNVVREQGRLRAAELNRDILIEAAKWEIDNLRFAVQQGMALEQLTQNLHENLVKRLFEVARFGAESQINVFNAQIALFNAQNGELQTLATIYRTRLDGALSKITAYRTAVEAQTSLGQFETEAFKAKLSGKIAIIQASVDKYKAMMQGAALRAQTIKDLFDAYRADVQAFSEEINAEKLKFDAYETHVKGETAKAGAQDAQARAYASTIQAIAGRADIKVKGAQLKLDAARTKISKFLADLDAHKAEQESSLRQAQYSTEVFKAQVEGWKAKTSASVADAEMQSRFADMNTRTNIAYSEMQISEFTAKMQKVVQEAQIALEAAKAVGQYTAQLAAGAMSAAHVSASISGSGSASSSDSRSESTSTNHNYNY